MQERHRHRRRLGDLRRHLHVVVARRAADLAAGDEQQHRLLVLDVRRDVDVESVLPENVLPRLRGQLQFVDRAAVDSLGADDLVAVACRRRRRRSPAGPLESRTWLQPSPAPRATASLPTTLRGEASASDENMASQGRKRMARSLRRNSVRRVDHSTQQKPRRESADLLAD